jgi:hypothetical protein
MNTIATSCILALFVLGAGCTGSGEGTGVVQLAARAEAAEDGTIRFPTLPVTQSHLELAVKEIQVHVAVPIDDEDTGRPSGETAPELDDGQWVTVAVDQRLALRPGANRIELGSTIVPTGQLTEVRLVLDGDAVLWNGGIQAQVDCPSCATSGLKLKIRDDVELAEGGVVDLLLTFDLEATAFQLDSGSKLGPVIHADAAAQP